MVQCDVSLVVVIKWEKEKGKKKSRLPLPLVIHIHSSFIRSLTFIVVSSSVANFCVLCVCVCIFFYIYRFSFYYFSLRAASVLCMIFSLIHPLLLLLCVCVDSIPLSRNNILASTPSISCAISFVSWCYPPFF